MLITEGYREQNRLLHGQNADYGTSSAKWVDYIARLAAEERHETILDYGCGKGLLAIGMEAHGRKVAEYDPAIPGKDGAPVPADLVVCGDVLEHIEKGCINAVIRHLRTLVKRKLFFTIALRPAAKTLPDGRNTHQLVKPPEWWGERLAREFNIVFWRIVPGMVYGEAVPKIAGLVPFHPPSKRRPMTPECAAMFAHIKTETNKYADAFNRVETVRMFEGVGDEIADVQVACNLFEHLQDPESALRAMLRMARKAVVCTIRLTPIRGESYWKTFFERFLRIAQWLVEGENALVIGAAIVHVEGVFPTGAVDSSTRWEQVKAAIKRFPRRIETRPAHGQRVILACYGPTLKDTIEALRKEAAETGGAVVSVSGAHDYLLSRGVIPKYHVECDPRPHKADNIAAGRAAVQYLLGSVVHPVLLDKLSDMDVRLWHVSTPELGTRVIDELGERGEHLISGGGSVGLRCIPLFYSMGFRGFSIHGMDCSFSDTGEQWAGPHAGKVKDVCEVACPTPGGMRTFKSSPVMLTYASNFFETISKVDDARFTVYGDGLLHHMCVYYRSHVSQLKMEQTAK